jgi:hypothetical protein
MEHGALKPDGEGFVAAMVEDGDEIASAAVMDSAANGFCTDRGFALDDKEAEAMAGRTSFHPRILGLGGTGERSVSPEARKSASPSKDEERGSALRSDSSVMESLI